MIGGVFLQIGSGGVWGDAEDGVFEIGNGKAAGNRTGGTPAAPTKSPLGELDGGRPIVVLMTHNIQQLNGCVKLLFLKNGKILIICSKKT